MPYLKTKTRLPLICFLVLLNCIAAAGQENSAKASPPDPALLKTVEAMQQQIRELQSAVADLRSQSASYRSETEALKRELQSARSAPTAAAPKPIVAQDEPYAPAPVDSQSEASQTPSLEEQLRLLTGKVNDQYQTKVESGSKYRVKLSGMMLLNLFSNRGTVDNIDIPGIAEPQSPLFGSGAFGGTFRQSQIGIDVVGPTWAGANVSGNLRFDFGGGFPDENNGAALALVRLRTGIIRLDWPKTSIIAGQDAPFFSALSPTSLASVALPSLSYAGNLWTWIPQLRVEHRMSLTANQSLLLQGGILDSFTGENPQSQFERSPHAGEASRQPAYAARLAWSSSQDENAATIGAGGYFGRQNWGFGRNVNGWAATADWQVPLNRLFSLSGEFYRGNAIGGLGAATDHSVLSSGVLNDSQSRVFGLDVVGGWGQLKLKASPTLQFNLAYGQDNPFAGELRSFSVVQNLLAPELGRNQVIMFNFIYRPKSNLLFSTEYRHINSVRLNQDRLSAEHVNMSIGVLF